MASHSQVAHRWAQDEGKPIKGFNMFFERREGENYGLGPMQIIYSHGMHFPIAAFVNAPNGERVVLANLSERRSVSTGKHQRTVRHAIPDRYQVFDVPYVDPMRKPGGSENFHEANLMSLLEGAAASYASGKRRQRDWGRAHDLEQAAKALDGARRYAALWGLVHPTYDLEAVAAELAVQKKEAAAKYAKERAEREEREKARLAALHVEQEPAFLDWMQGKGWRVPSTWTEDENGSVYVRRYRSEHETVDDGVTSPAEDKLETSRGASAPWKHAVRVFQFAKLCRESGKGFKANGRVIRVGHFTVDSIDEQGNMRAGCHYFAWERMAELALREGVFEVEPSAEVVETR